MANGFVKALLKFTVGTMCNLTVETVQGVVFEEVP